MPATIHPLPVRTPDPSLTAALEALDLSASTGCAAILAAAPPPERFAFLIDIEEQRRAQAPPW